MNDVFLRANSEERVMLIKIRLATVLAPVISIDIQDDSLRHAGHVGATMGGHYSVIIVTDVFVGKSRVVRHHMVYDALADAMQCGIHALTIVAYTPEEVGLLAC